MTKQIWIIDDEQAICWALRRAMEQHGYLATTYSNAEDALEQLSSNTPLDAVMLDMRMPGMDGFAATAILKKRRPDVPIIMMTAFGDLSSAMKAMDLDIFEYLVKPFDLSDGIKAVTKAMASQVSPSPAEVAGQVEETSLLGSSAAMQQVYKSIAIAAKSDVSVLITGPNGIGKEAVASAIHRNSLRSDSPFLSFAPNAIPPIAVATELLGSVYIPQGQAGSLDRSGAFELAGDGTLFIDEVTDLPFSLQRQLLRVLEQQEYTKLGDSRARPCKARIIASTNRSLANVVAEGEFLDELRQRLSVFPIELKPLSERAEDILPLANSILRSHPLHQNRCYSKAAEHWLASMPWPGNIRELRSVIEHALVNTRSQTIEIEDLDPNRSKSKPAAVTDGNSLAEEVNRWTLSYLEELDRSNQRVRSLSDDVFGNMYEDFLAAVEPPMLETMMESSNRNRALIAAQLGIHRSTLRQKMKRYQIDG